MVIDSTAGPELARKAGNSLADNRRLAEWDQPNLQALRSRLRRKPMIEVPELDHEVHDVKALGRVTAHLFGADPGARRLIRPRYGSRARAASGYATEPAGHFQRMWRPVT